MVCIIQGDVLATACSQGAGAVNGDQTRNISDRALGGDAQSRRSGGGAHGQGIQRRHAACRQGQRAGVGAAHRQAVQIVQNRITCDCQRHSAAKVVQTRQRHARSDQGRRSGHIQRTIARQGACAV